MNINIVALDGYTMNPGDLSWDGIRDLGNFTFYDRTPKEKIIDRSIDADIILTNKVPLSRSIIQGLPRLKFICITATGYNNVDLKAAKERSIPVSNAVGYSTSSVAQHVFALILAFTNRIETHSQSVKRDEWSQKLDFCYTLSPISELKDKVIGIYGFGRIGQQVAKIGQSFEMKVLATHKHPKRDAQPGVEFVDLPTLFKRSDFISLHAPLSEKNYEIVNYDYLSLMKASAYLINTGRGGLIHETDLGKALQEKLIGGAALDVLQKEPPAPKHPLLQYPNCIITPHIAWISKEARHRLLAITINNIISFLEGSPQNVVNG